MTRKENKKVMYLGPTIRGVVKNGAVFEGGIPKNLEKIAGKKPIIQNLIVPLETLWTFQRISASKEQRKRLPSIKSQRSAKRK